jgi:hypothetical protein
MVRRMTLRFVGFGLVCEWAAQPVMPLELELQLEELRIQVFWS